MGAKIQISSKYKFEPLKYNVLSSLCPMDENPGQHEQVLHQPAMFCFLNSNVVNKNSVE